MKNNLKKKTYSEVISSITSPPQHSEDNSVLNDNQPVCEEVLTESDKHNISTDKNVIPDKISDTVTNHIESVPTPKQPDSKMQPNFRDSIIATLTDSSASNTTPAVTSSPRRQDVDAKTTTAQSKKIGVRVSSDQCCDTLSTQPAFSG